MQQIAGIGTDITSIIRMKQILEKSYKLRFLTKTLHNIEIEQLQKKSSIQQQAEFLASRWAFKEAVVKATGRVDLIYPEMYLQKNDLKQPFIKFENYNENVIYKELKLSGSHVSISHEDEYAVAFVIMYKQMQME